MRKAGETNGQINDGSPLSPPTSPRILPQNADGIRGFSRLRAETAPSVIKADRAAQGLSETPLSPRSEKRSKSRLALEKLKHVVSKPKPSPESKKKARKTSEPQPVIAEPVKKAKKKRSKKIKENSQAGEVSSTLGSTQDPKIKKVETLVQFLKKHKVEQTDGIFRQSGNSDELKRLKSEFINGEAALEDLSITSDYSVATLLKQSIGDLNLFNGLIEGKIPKTKTLKAGLEDFLKDQKADKGQMQSKGGIEFDKNYALLKSFIASLKDKPLQVWEKLLLAPLSNDSTNEIKNIIDSLDEEKKQALKCVVLYLNEVLKFSDVNKTTFYSLGMAFGPNLIPSDYELVDLELSGFLSTLANAAFKTMIEESNTIFDICDSYSDRLLNKFREERVATSTPDAPEKTDDSENTALVRDGSFIHTEGDVTEALNEVTELPSPDEIRDESDQEGVNFEEEEVQHQVTPSALEVAFTDRPEIIPVQVTSAELVLTSPLSKVVIPVQTQYTPPSTPAEPLEVSFNETPEIIPPQVTSTDFSYVKTLALTSSIGAAAFSIEQFAMKRGEELVRLLSPQEEGGFLRSLASYFPSSDSASADPIEASDVAVCSGAMLGLSVGIYKSVKAFGEFVAEFKTSSVSKKGGQLLFGTLWGGLSVASALVVKNHL